MNVIEQHLQTVRQRIQDAADSSGRNVQEISLLAVSKTRPASDIELAHSAGQSEFGENYLQEALEKIKTLQHLPLTWHFIGRLQSNKTRAIAENFSWVHTLDSFKHARRLSEQRPPQLPPINLCIQVNISAEASKGGVEPNQAEQLAKQVAELPGLQLRGLMTIPRANMEPKELQACFKQLADLQQQLNNSGLRLDTLSMGMSADLDIAIAAGATIVRIGTAIFGERPAKLADGP